VYPNLTPTLVGLLAAALLVTGAIALRGPLVRRLALRQLDRRRGEAALVVTGSVLGTAIIVGSFIVGDTLNFSVKRNAYDHLGVIDEVVSSPTPAQGEDAARRLAALAGDPDVDGLLTVRLHRAAVAKGNGQAAAGRKAEPRATVVEVDFAAATRFEGVGARLAEREAAGLAGPPPAAGEVVLNDELAGSLGARTGDRLTFYVYGEPVELRVARVVPTRGLAGYGGASAFLQPGALEDAVGAGAKATSALLGTAPGVSDETLAADLQGEFLPNGLVTTRIRHMVEVSYAANRSFFQLMQGFLALGLVVGVAGLGVVMVRAVRERRRTVGVLRALGFPAKVVRRAFLIESSFVALEGILLGTALSIVTAYLLFRNDDELQAAGGNFPIPWLAIAVLVVATAIASLAATAWPARQAARIHPAVALRIAD